MTILAAVMSMVIILAGCYILLRNLYNIAEALTSGMEVVTAEETRENSSVHYRKALVAG